MRQHYMLLWYLRLHAVLDVGRTRVEELTQRRRELGVKRHDAYAWAQAADWIEPVGVRIVEDGVGTFNERLNVERNPQGGRTICHAVAKEAGRRNACNRDGVRLNEDGRSDYGSISAKVALP